MGAMADGDGVSEHHRARRPAFCRWLGAGVMGLSRWKLVGGIPSDRKIILVLGPHTSNWDFVVAVAAMLALDLRVHWVGKHSLFKTPLGPLLKLLGGIPVDRTRPQGFAEGIIEQMRRVDNLVITITPEGTRSPVKKLKTGFSRIARDAPCPYVPVILDYSSREIRLLSPCSAQADPEKDAELIQRLFASARPKKPQNFICGPD